MPARPGVKRIDAERVARRCLGPGDRAEHRLVGGRGRRDPLGDAVDQQCAVGPGHRQHGSHQPVARRRQQAAEARRERDRSQPHGQLDRDEAATAEVDRDVAVLVAARALGQADVRARGGRRSRAGRRRGPATRSRARPRRSSGREPAAPRTPPARPRRRGCAPAARPCRRRSRGRTAHRRAASAPTAASTTRPDRRAAARRSGRRAAASGGPAASDLADHGAVARGRLDDRCRGPDALQRRDHLGRHRRDALAGGRHARLAPVRDQLVEEPRRMVGDVRVEASEVRHEPPSSPPQ